MRLDALTRKVVDHHTCFWLVFNGHRHTDRNGPVLLGEVLDHFNLFSKMNRSTTRPLFASWLVSRSISKSWFDQFTRLFAQESADWSDNVFSHGG